MYDNLENMIQIAFLDSAWESDRCVQGKRLSAKALSVKKDWDFTTALGSRNYRAFGKGLVFTFPSLCKPNSLDME